VKIIAETAWHHEGDFGFMKNLVSEIATRTETDIVKMHITLDFDEYLDPSHENYALLKPWLFNKGQWSELIDIVRDNGKQIMLLLNDTEAIEFGLSFNPEYAEIHSVCLNDVFMLDALKKNLSKETKFVFGVGGTSVDEVDHAINYLDHSNMLIMFGFQNYPTEYKDVNLNKTRKIMKLFSEFEFGYADHTAWNHPHNELITLLGTASGMSYVEKHVTTHYGEERIDWHATISIEMFNDLHDKVKILDSLNGDGKLSMNKGELSYSVFGPMKKAAVLKKNVKKGDVFSLGMIKFIRIKKVSDMSQINVIQSVGKVIKQDIGLGAVLMHEFFTGQE